MPIFDAEFLDEPLLDNIYSALEEHQKELKFLLLALQIGGIGPWEQYDTIDVYLTKTWHRVFGISGDESICLDEYYDLIDDATERQRVRQSRENLASQAIGTKWSDTFTLAGKAVRSFAFVSESATVVGVDVVR